MTINEILDHAYEDYIGRLFVAFIMAVSGAENKETEISIAAERFKAGVALAKEVLEKAKLTIEN